MHPVDQTCQIFLTIRTTDNLLLVGVLCQDVVLQHHEHVGQLSVHDLWVRATCHWDTVVPVTGADRTLQLDFIVISDMSHDLLSVTKVDVGNDLVNRVEVQGAKLTF